MEVVSIESKPFINTVEPCIKFDLKLSYDSFESVLGIDGLLLAEDEKVLGVLQELRTEVKGFQIGQIASKHTSEDRTLGLKKEHEFSLLATFTKSTLDYLERIREREPHKNVIFKLRLRIRALLSHTVIFPLVQLKPADFGLGRSFENADHVIGYRYRTDFSIPQSSEWIISGRGSPVFLEILDIPYETQITIKRSEWIDEYVPQLGLGKFMTIEIPKLEKPEQEDLAKAFYELEHAQSYLRDPDKNIQVLTSIRNAIDHLLISKEEEGEEQKVRAYYIKENLKAVIFEQAPADAKDIYKEVFKTIESSLRGIRNNLIGQFIHLDTGKLLKTPLRADVEHVFMEAMNLLRYLSQLISSTRPI